MELCVKLAGWETSLHSHQHHENLPQTQVSLLRRKHLFHSMLHATNRSRYAAACLAPKLEHMLTKYVPAQQGRGVSAYASACRHALERAIRYVSAQGTLLQPGKHVDGTANMKV